MFIIIDWANNHLFNDKEFETFEEGFDFLLQKFSDEELEDLFVVDKKEYQPNKHLGINWN